jgi:putrescine aminotransferase
MTPTITLQALDAAHHLHPFTDHGALARQGTRVITRAEGVYLWDNDGHQILDAMSGLWCVNVGYGRQELVDAAIRQLRTLPYYNSFFQCTTPPAIELAELLTELTPPHINHVFFTCSGSDANDTVVRLVRHYWACEGKPEKQIIISRKNAYHGSTMAGASLGGMAPMHAQGGLPIPGIVHINQPYWFGEGRAEEPGAFGVRIARELEQRIDALGEDHVAAFIAEPVQGAGGVIVAPETYWPEIRRICSEREILLVVDEVICGFGRLGRWFGSDYYGVSPDLMPIAKAMASGYMPIGGLLVADRVAQTLKTKSGEFFHGFTWSGHPVACAVALANLRILRDERIPERVDRDVAPYLQRRWRTLAEHPLVGEVRGVGLLGALELVRSKSPVEQFADKGAAGLVTRDLAIQNGLVMRAVGSTMIIAPPLIITHAQIDELVDKARRTLDAAAKVLLG